MIMDNKVVSLPTYACDQQHSISGLSSGAFMTVQMHIAHSSAFVGAGVIAGGPYRSAETFLEAAPTPAMSCILNSLYIAMQPLTPATAPDVEKLVALTHSTPNIDDTAHLQQQKLYLFTGTKDEVVNQHAVRSTLEYYKALGVSSGNIKFVDDVAAGHSIVTTNPENPPLHVNRPPYINRGDFMQSHDILRHIYPSLAQPSAPEQVNGELIRFDQSEFYAEDASESSMSEYAYAYIPSAVKTGATAKGVHIVMHGCEQGYDYTNFVHGKADIANQPPYGARYITTTGYIEMAEANNLLLLFPQVSGTDNNKVQNPEGCWDWWGYSSTNENQPDYFTQEAVQIKALYAMLERLGGPID